MYRTATIGLCILLTMSIVAVLRYAAHDVGEKLPFVKILRLAGLVIGVFAVCAVALSLIQENFQVEGMAGGIIAFCIFVGGYITIFLLVDKIGRPKKGSENKEAQNKSGH